MSYSSQLTPIVTPSTPLGKNSRVSTSKLYIKISGGKSRYVVRECYSPLGSQICSTSGLAGRNLCSGVVPPVPEWDGSLDSGGGVVGVVYIMIVVSGIGDLNSR